MPEPERSIEEMVEDLLLADADSHINIVRRDAARAALLRAVARLREENERLQDVARLARAQLLVVGTYRSTPPTMAEECRVVRRKIHAALTPKGGDRE